MTKLNLSRPRPSFWQSLRLKCPYCGQEPLIKGRTWFVFRQGCKGCNYRYEREIGYFTGASWMVNFPVTGCLGFLLATYLVLGTSLSAIAVAIIDSVFVLTFCLVFFPFSQGLWMVIEQSFYPLNAEDALDYKKEQ